MGPLRLLRQVRLVSLSPFLSLSPSPSLSLSLCLLPVLRGSHSLTSPHTFPPSLTHSLQPIQQTLLRQVLRIRWCPLSHLLPHLRALLLVNPVVALPRFLPVNPRNLPLVYPAVSRPSVFHLAAYPLSRHLDSLLLDLLLSIRSNHRKRPPIRLYRPRRRPRFRLPHRHLPTPCPRAFPRALLVLNPLTRLPPRNPPSVLHPPWLPKRMWCENLKQSC
jgi:hypothetical protein